MTRFNKLLAALAGAATLAVTQGLVDGTAAKWVGIAVGFLTAAGVYAAPANEPADDETLIRRLREGFPIPDNLEEG